MLGSFKLEATIWDIGEEPEDQVLFAMLLSTVYVQLDKKLAFEVGPLVSELREACLELKQQTQDSTALIRSGGLENLGAHWSERNWPLTVSWQQPTQFWKLRNPKYRPTEGFRMRPRAKPS